MVSFPAIAFHVRNALRSGRTPFELPASLLLALPLFHEFAKLSELTTAISPRPMKLFLLFLPLVIALAPAFQERDFALYLLRVWHELVRVDGENVEYKVE